MIGETKKCSSCKKELPKSLFWRNRSSSDGLQQSCTPCRKEYSKRYGNDIRRKYNYDNYHKNPEHRRARAMVMRYLIKGKLVRGICEVCGDPKTHAHHYKGYAKENRLDIKWLCSKHHADEEIKDKQKRPKTQSVESIQKSRILYKLVRSHSSKVLVDTFLLNESWSKVRDRLRNEYPTTKVRYSYHTNDFTIIFYSKDEFRSLPTN